jgi:hypothetical protein
MGRPSKAAVTHRAASTRCQSVFVSPTSLMYGTHPSSLSLLPILCFDRGQRQRGDRVKPRVREGFPRSPLLYHARQGTTQPHSSAAHACRSHPKRTPEAARERAMTHRARPPSNTTKPSRNHSWHHHSRITPTPCALDPSQGAWITATWLGCPYHRLPTIVELEL